MASKIILKNSSVAARVPNPADLDLGEIAVNTTDGKMFLKKGDGTIVEVGTGAQVTTSKQIILGIYPQIGVETLTDRRLYINDKPIYTQIFTVNLGNPAASGTISTGLTGLEMCSVANFTLYRPNGTSLTESASWQASTTSQLYALTTTNAATITYQISAGNANFSDSDLYVTLEYTKTSDTSSSPIAGLIAQPGDTLQTVFSTVDILNSNVFVANETLIDFNVTPKSNNSTFIVESAYPIYMDSDTEHVSLSFKVDDVDAGKLVDYWQGNHQIAYTGSGIRTYSNTTIDIKNIKLYISSIQNTPSRRSVGIQGMIKITEIQN